MCNVRIFINLLLFFILIPQLSCGQENLSHEEPLKFCVFPNKSPRIIYSMYHPLVERLSEATGRRVELVTAPDKKTFQQRALAGEYDLAVACVACYFQLRDQSGYRAIVRGEPSFRGGVLVKKDSPFTSPKQLLGRKVAVMRRHSYAGYLFFQAYLAEHYPEAEFQPKYIFLDQLESDVYAVLTGEADACVIRLDALNTSKLGRYRDQLRIILESVEIPQFPFIVSPDLDPHLVRDISGALTSLEADDPTAKNLFKALNITSLEAVSDADYKQFELEYTRSMRKAGEKRSK